MDSPDRPPKPWNAYLPWRAQEEQRPSPKDLRASDADREQVAEILREALADGRLQPDEHAERVERVYVARTLGDLSGLTEDLVEEAPIQVDTPAAHAFLGSTRRDGRWVVPVRFPVSAYFGTVELDVREALLQRRHVVIEANVICGKIRLLVPDGVRVEFTGRTIASTRDLRARPAGDAPVIEVTGTIVFGQVIARAPKRPWRARFRRRSL